MWGVDGVPEHDAGVHGGVRRQEREALGWGVLPHPSFRGSLRGEVAGDGKSGGMVSVHS